METKIYVCTHKKFIKPKEDIYVPIRVGSALGDDFGYLRDDEGDNISFKNGSFCELTGVYWVWKHAKSDIVGICHYRRYFMTENKAILSAADMTEYLKEYDAIIPAGQAVPAESLWEQYKNWHNISDLEITREVISEKYPDYLESFDRVMKDRIISVGNMLVAPKKVYDEYCSWLFDIIFEVEKRVDISKYDSYQYRLFGFITERLMRGFFLNGEYKVKEIKVEMVAPDEIEEEQNEQADIHIDSSWYKDFFCTGGECGMTCCGGWKIALSGEEVETYRGLRSQLPDIMDHIDVKERCMHQENGHCTLLTKDGWCTLVMNYGEAAISATCQLFPRSERDYGNVAERSVTISCPAVAERMLSDEHMVLYADNEIENLTDKNYDSLFMLREYLFDLIAKEDRGLPGKVYIILKIADWVWQAMEDETLSPETANETMLQWQAMEEKICSDMAPLSEGYELKAGMLNQFFSLYGRNLNMWLTIYPSLTYEEYVPEIFKDIECWKADQSVLINDLKMLKDFLAEDHPMFADIYLEQMVYMSFIQKKSDKYSIDFFFRYVELVFIELFVMSRLRHGESIDKEAFSVLIAWTDRVLFYNDSARRFVGHTIGEIKKSESLDLFYFPVY